MSEPDIFEQSGLFGGLTEGDASEARRAFQALEMRAGARLLIEGEAEATISYVVTGHLVATLKGTLLGRIGPAETVGEMAMFGSVDRRSATVVTETVVRLLQLDAERVRALRMRDNLVLQRLETHAMRTVAQRLRRSDTRIVELASPEGKQEPSASGLFARLAAGLGLGRGGGLPTTPPPRPVAVLRNTPGFAMREEAALDRLAARFEGVPFAEGAVVVAEGEPPGDVFIVAEGRVAVFRNVAERRVERIAELGPGHVVGAVALADDGSRSSTVRALQPSWLLRIGPADFRLLESHLGAEGRAFRRGMVDALSAQLRLANERIHRLADVGGHG